MNNILLVRELKVTLTPFILMLVSDQPKQGTPLILLSSKRFYSIVYVCICFLEQKQPILQVVELHLEMRRQAAFL